MKLRTKRKKHFLEGGNKKTSFCTKRKKTLLKDEKTKKTSFRTKRKKTASRK